MGKMYEELMQGITEAIEIAKAKNAKKFLEEHAELNMENGTIRDAKEMTDASSRLSDEIKNIKNEVK